MSLDNLSDTIDSATTSVSDAVNSAVSGVSSVISGAASALSSIGNAVSGALSSLGIAFKPIPNISLPLSNPLHDYASYTYVLGLCCLSDDQLNNPDKSYMSGVLPPQIIAKDANADPKNRVVMDFGSFDYFMDKLELASVIGFEKGHNTNVQKIDFEVREPYSMGTFMMSLQQAAWNAGHDNYIQAPFLITIDFRGEKENGVMINIPNTARRIPIKFQDISMTVTEAGAVYKCAAVPFNSKALSGHVSQIKNDASVKGITVQEVLQTGEKSLQAAMNKRLQQLKVTGPKIETPDQIVILFPTDVSSSSSNGSAGDTEESTGATTQTDASSIDAVAKKLGLTKSSIPANGTLVQDPASVNEIGKAKMGFSDTRKGDAPMGKDNKTVVNGNVIRSNNTVDPQVGDMRFSQDTDITTAIDTVLLNSEYATKQLDEKNIDDKGQRKWWRIDTQVYNISDNSSNAASTGDKPRIIVYRIVPYGVHTSAVTATNSKPPGLANLGKECVKEYNYIYTGKNVDVLSFNITVNTAFAPKMGATAAKKTIDNQQQASQSGADDKGSLNLQPLEAGKTPEKKLGIQPQLVRYSSTTYGSVGRGGGGLGNEKTFAAQQFHDAITSSASMQNLDMKIIGDPYWIAQSGTGNYTSTPTQYQNLNTDYTVNYQNGEVHVMVNFRSPVDINQSTGLYDFGKGAGKSIPLLQWSGIYKVINVISSFNGGSFTQTFPDCPRINGYELTGAGDTKNTLNVSNEQKDPEPKK